MSASSTRWPRWCSRNSPCRTPACSGAPKPHWRPAIVDEFPLNDQEILVRHLHKVVVDWVEQYQRESSSVSV